MRAVAKEFPDVKIFCYRLFSDLLPMLDSGDLTRALEPDTYGLQPSFVDGWMDALPPGLTVVEGTEDIGDPPIQRRNTTPPSPASDYGCRSLSLPSIARNSASTCASGKACISTQRVSSRGRLRRQRALMST